MPSPLYFFKESKMAKVKVLMNSGIVKEMEKRFARALVHVGKATIIDEKVVKADSYVQKVVKHEDVENKSSDELDELKEVYKEKFGKRPFHGWGLDVLKSKIAEAE